MINVGVVGGTGYTGVELLRLLALHPDVVVKAVTFAFVRCGVFCYPECDGHAYGRRFIASGSENNRLVCRL